MLAVGELPAIRIGRSVRVPRAALEHWIAEHTQHASAEAGMPVPFVEVEDQDGVPGAGPSPLARDLRREPILSPRWASRKASSRASS
jgi:hypothetical protein